MRATMTRSFWRFRLHYWALGPRFFPMPTTAHGKHCVSDSDSLVENKLTSKMYVKKSYFSLLLRRHVALLIIERHGGVDHIVVD
jgi:hypothetical protein